MKTHEQIIASLSFFTRLPGLAITNPATGSFSQLSWTFPIVGALIGTLSGLMYGVLHYLGISPPLAATLTLACHIALTGALHEDGLADMTDGFFGGRDTLSRLTIMRDSRIGSFGALALIASFFLRAAAIAELSSPHIVYIACVIAGTVSRAVIPIGMYVLPHARLDGLAAWAGKPPAAHVVTGLIMTSMITVALVGLPGVKMLVIALLACAGICLLAHRKIGGITGDVYGAIQQIVEIAVLITATVTLHA